MQEVKDWLESKKRDYSTGIGLLGKYSKNRILIQNLARKARPEKLIYELTKICSRDKIVVNTSEAILPPLDSPVLGEIKDFIKTKPVLLYSQLPDHIKVLRKENIEKYKKARALHEKAKLVKTAEERVPLLQELEVLRASIFENWAFIDNYIDGQEVNKNGQELSKDCPKLDEKGIKAARTYLSKGIDTVDKLSGAAKAKKIEAMQKRVNNLLEVKAEFTDEYIGKLKAIGISFNG